MIRSICHEAPGGTTIGESSLRQDFLFIRTWTRIVCWASDPWVLVRRFQVSIIRYQVCFFSSGALLQWNEDPFLFLLINQPTTRPSYILHRYTSHSKLGEKTWRRPSILLVNLKDKMSKFQKNMSEEWLHPATKNHCLSLSNSDLRRNDPLTHW